MRNLRIISLPAILILALAGNSIADLPELVIWNGSGTYEIGSGKEWFQILELRTYDTVNVIMPGGGGVNAFKMYDDSSLTMYDSFINNLYLYGNTTASFYGGSSSMDWYIDPANTGWVKMYGHLDRFDPYGPYGEGTMHGTWLSNGYSFNIDLTGHGAYSHIQFIPEPATLLLLSLGGLALRRRK